MSISSAFPIRVLYCFCNVSYCVLLCLITWLILSWFVLSATMFERFAEPPKAAIGVIRFFMCMFPTLSGGNALIEVCPRTD